MKTTLAGMLCEIEITHFRPWKPARLDGAMEDAQESEDGEIEFKIVDGMGFPADWLLSKATAADYDRIYEDYLDTLEEI